MFFRTSVTLVFTIFPSFALSTDIDERTVILAMNKEGRLTQDVSRDSRSRPEKVIPLLRLESGDRVADIFGGGGYYSELLAAVIGHNGEVLLHNGLNDRFAQNRNPGNITRHTRSGINLELESNSLDGILIVMAFHDLYVIPKRYNGKEYVPVGRPANTEYFLEQIFSALKPGGRFVVVDHSADASMDLETLTDLHRIEESFVRQEIESAGFEFVESSEALRNPADDGSLIVFDLDVQGKTDRFIFAFEKPQIN
jgi:predicted methyltransferase